MMCFRYDNKHELYLKQPIKMHQSLDLLS